MKKKKLKIPTQSVIRLAKPIEATNRNITADNWFSSIELVEKLKSMKLTYVGTLRKNKKEIPPCFLPNRKREVGSCLYGFTKDITIISFVPKKGKAVVLVSSMHHSKLSINEKPEIIDFYNSTKGGVDSLDEKCAVYSSSRRTQRWPMAVFFQILDMSTVNAFIMFQTYKGNLQITRLDFMKQLAMELVRPHLERRYLNKRISTDIRKGIGRVLNIPESEEVEETLEKRKYCYLCPSRLHRKTKYQCFQCKKPICLECAKKVCRECLTKND